MEKFLRNVSVALFGGCLAAVIILSYIVFVTGSSDFQPDGIPSMKVSLKALSSIVKIPDKPMEIACRSIILVSNPGADEESMYLKKIYDPYEFPNSVVNSETECGSWSQIDTWVLEGFFILTKERG